ncbi:MAG: ABC transporter permease [Phycisphaerales bacterium]|nr:ABC transporter permease [Phycisphaerales bacterium]
MHPSWRLARNSLAGRPGRTALMIGAVALAAALITAFSCAINSVHASMELNIVRILGASDARVIHQFNGRFSENVLDTVRRWPEVKAATGRLGDQLALSHVDMRIDPKTGDPARATPFAVGVEFDYHEQFRTTDLMAGSRPKAANEILIDSITAQELGAAVGDVLAVRRAGEPMHLIVTGINQRPRMGKMQQPMIEIDRRTLATAVHRPGELTSIAIILNEGENVDVFCKRHASELPAALALEPAEMVRAGFNRQLVASRFGFIVGSMMTFLCASFIIVTALTTSVIQRQREMAVTRCIGASRGQLFGSQLAAGAAISGFGALIGIPLGIGLAALLTWHFEELLPSGLRVHWLGVVLATAGSIGAGLLGSIYPAWLASRVAPLKAMTYQGSPPRARNVVWAGIAGLALITIQLGLLLIPDASARFFAYAYAGMPLLLTGYFILAVPILAGVAVLAGPALSKLLGLPGPMIGRSILATPFRQGFTAGALMVGVAILVSTWSTMTSIMNDWMGKIRFADGFIQTWAGLSPDQQQALARLPFVKRTCPIGMIHLRVLDRQVFGVEDLTPSSVNCINFDPDVFFSINAIEWVAGEPSRAIAKLKDGSGIIVADRFLTTRRVNIGDRLVLGGDRVHQAFEIVGAVNSAGLDVAVQAFGIRSQYMELAISCVFMDRQTVSRVFDNRDVNGLQLVLADDVDDKEAIRRVGEVVPGARFFSGRWIRATINEVATAMLVVQSTVAMAALVLASLAMGNVILANIHGRRFEYGVLRAVGAHRRVLVRLILGESAVLAIAGAVTGTILGLHLAWVGAAHYRDLAGLPIHLTLPKNATATGWIVLLILTLLASVPGVMSVIRRQPSALLAAGRNG